MKEILRGTGFGLGFAIGFAGVFVVAGILARKGAASMVNDFVNEHMAES